ncbi:F-box domain containing protein, partial [Trema orientale]
MANRVKIAKLEAEPETAAASKFMSSTATVTDDLLLEIFVRLPNPRSAIQCSLVCKRWFSLISCPEFRRDFVHRRHDHQRPFTALSDRLPLCQLFSEKSEITRQCGKTIGYGDPCWISQLLLEKSKSKSKSKSTSLYEQPIRGGYGDIVSSFHDLLLISYSLKDYYICNPLTKQSVALPAPPVQCWPEHIKLVFEHPSCPDKRAGCSCGFSDSRFRVLLFNHRIDDYLFCSETGQWSRVILPFNTAGRWIFSSVAPCNGIFHFLDEKDKKLIAFDPFEDADNSPDRCRSIDLPVLSGAPHNKIERRLGVVRNQ